jgi:hypothetical protein
MLEEKQIPRGFIAFASGNPALAETLETAA